MSLTQLALVIPKCFIMRFDFRYEEVKNTPISQLLKKLIKLLFPAANVNVSPQFFQDEKCTLQYDSKTLKQSDNCYAKLGQSEYRKMLDKSSANLDEQNPEVAGKQDKSQEKGETSKNLQSIRQGQINIGKLDNKPGKGKQTDYNPGKNATTNTQEKLENQSKPQQVNSSFFDSCCKII